MRDRVVAMHSGLFPPPLRGRVREGGREFGEANASRRTPTPNPSPQGGGERTTRGRGNRPPEGQL